MTSYTAPAAADLHVVRYEDAEGDGRCGHCDREGLRWLAHLSDGTAVGTGCMRKVLGIPNAPAATVRRLIGYTVEATANGFSLWISASGAYAAITHEGVEVGRGRRDASLARTYLVRREFADLIAL